MQDRNGLEIKVGDIVNVPCVVEDVTGTDWNNARLRTLEPNHPGQYRTELGLNTKQIEFVSRVESTGLEAGTAAILDTPPVFASGELEENPTDGTAPATDPQE